MTTKNTAAAGDKRVVRRHSIATRLWHWLNAICLLVLLMSGLQIFNAHPALYWGQDSPFDSPLLSIGARRGPDGTPQGITRIGGLTLHTTGVLGLSYSGGQPQVRAFPAWATLPGVQWLSLGRQWHFTAAWIFGVILAGYLLYSLISRRRRRAIGPRAHEWRQIGSTAVEHARFKFPRVRNYNIIQKLTYLLVLFVLLPLMVLTGLTMSPTMDAAWPWLLTVFDGRQSARTIHFFCAFSLLGFFFIHILLVLVSGLVNNMRSMITGGYRISDETSGQNATRAEATHE